jgi:hypothetical protein
VSRRFSEHDFPGSLQPFTQRRQFDATLSYKGKTLDVEVVLDWDVLGRSAPHGWILGNNHLSKVIEHLDDPSYLPRGAVIAAADPDADADAITVTVNLTMLQRRGYEKGPTGIVATFAGREVTFDHRFHEPSGPKRRLTFLMAGPEVHWAAYHRREVSYTGNAKVEPHRQEFLVDLELPFSLEIRPHFFYSPLGEEREHQACAHVLSISATTETSQDVLPDEEFVRTASAVIDDASLLVSFLSGSWATWYGYMFAAGDHFAEHFRHARQGRPDIDRFDIPVDMSKTREFVKVAVGRLRQLRTEKRDPRLALLHAISRPRPPHRRSSFSAYSSHSRASRTSTRAPVERTTSSPRSSSLRCGERSAPRSKISLLPALSA